MVIVAVMFEVLRVKVALRLLTPRRRNRLRLGFGACTVVSGYKSNDPIERVYDVIVGPLRIELAVPTKRMKGARYWSWPTTYVSAAQIERHTPTEPQQAVKTSPARAKLTPAEEREQAISFAYGNAKLSNPAITRELVERAYDDMRAKKVRGRA